jgi:hypothetical protein
LPLRIKNTLGRYPTNQSGLGLLIRDPLNLVVDGR